MISRISSFKLSAASQMVYRSFNGLQGEVEGRAPIGIGLDPYSAAVAFYDPLADGQPDARAGILVLSVQPLEDFEYAIIVAGINTYSVVMYAEDPFVLPWFARNVDYGGDARFPELDRVRNQVLNQLQELRLIAKDNGQFALCNSRAPFLDSALQVPHGVLHDAAHIDLLKWVSVCCDTGVRKKIADHR
jgi:hypothetical protein